jgi:hypothetical protein
MQIEEVLTAPRSHFQNPYAERVIGSIRLECLNYLIIIGIMSAIRLVLGCRSNQCKEFRLGPRAMCIAVELRAVDLSSIHQFEVEIGDSSSENRLFIPKMEFSARTAI